MGGISKSSSDLSGDGGSCGFLAGIRSGLIGGMTFGCIGCTKRFRAGELPAGASGRSALKEARFATLNGGRAPAAEEDRHRDG